jgi:hypothetical protein
MNKQEYNELNLIISYVALLVSNGDWKPPRMRTYSANYYYIYWTLFSAHCLCYIHIDTMSSACVWTHCILHSRVKSISALRYFPIYFISNHLFSKHSPEVIHYLIFMKFSALNAEINIVSSYIILFFSPNLAI